MHSPPHLRQCGEGGLIDVREAAREAEATQLEASVLIQEDVGGLQVGVDDGVGVQVLGEGEGRMGMGWSAGIGKGGSGKQGEQGVSAYVCSVVPGRIRAATADQ